MPRLSSTKDIGHYELTKEGTKIEIFHTSPKEKAKGERSGTISAVLSKSWWPRSSSDSSTFTSPESAGSVLR